MRAKWIFYRSLFAFSVETNALGGNLVWLVLALVALLGAVAACRIPSDRRVMGPESGTVPEAPTRRFPDGHDDPSSPD